MNKVSTSRFLFCFIFYFIITSSKAQLTVNAGDDQNICPKTTITIGGSPPATGGVVPYTYLWTPSIGLSSNTSPNPIASPSSTISYTITVTDSTGIVQTDFVTITVNSSPPINAGNDTIIKQGERAILHASGGSEYDWSPKNTLTYYNTATPNAEPTITTSYYLYGTDASYACPNYDTVTVFVEPSNDVMFYNTFTPNEDKNNDTWYIGNILKYPNNKLEIYNRYGKLVYKAKGYLNNWDGTSFGEELPAATYFYILELGDGGAAFHGTVTIIK